MTSCLKQRESHPHEKDDEAHQGEWYMKVKKAMAQVTVGAAKWLTEWLI